MTSQSPDVIDCKVSPLLLGCQKKRELDFFILKISYLSRAPLLKKGALLTPFLIKNKPSICNFRPSPCYLCEFSGIEIIESENYLNHNSAEDNGMNSVQNSFKPLPLIQRAHRLLINPLWQCRDLLIYVQLRRY